MIKFNAGYSKEREATLIGLGLTDGNLNRLFADAITLRGEDMNLPDSHFIIFAGDKDSFEEHIKEVAEKLSIKDLITVMHMNETFYLSILPAINRLIYVIGLDEVSYKTLRKGKTLNFRARFQDKGTPIEVFLFWGPNEKAIEEGFYKAGLIGDKTKVYRS